MLGDQSALDDLNSGPPPSIHLVCQPGNGGPVEDWCNVEILHNNASPGTATITTNAIVMIIIQFIALVVTVDGLMVQYINNEQALLDRLRKEHKTPVRFIVS